MEKFSGTLEDLFQDKLLIYQELKTIIEEERDYISALDVDSLWKMAERKKQLALQIEDRRSRIIDLIQKHRMPIEMTVGTFNTTRIIQEYPVPEKFKFGLKSLNVQLNTVKKEITVLGTNNRQFVNEHLSIVDGIFATITGVENGKRYNRNGMVYNNPDDKPLIRAAV